MWDRASFNISKRAGSSGWDYIGWQLVPLLKYMQVCQFTEDLTIMWNSTWRYSLLTAGSVLQTQNSNSLGGSPHQCGITGHIPLLNTVSVPLDPHAYVLYILGLQTAPSPKVPRWEDFHFAALQPHPRQTWYVDTRTHMHRSNRKENNKRLVISHSIYFLSCSCCFCPCVPFCVKSR